MNLLPEPLHPAVVHFPIVLILLGAVMMLAAVAWCKHHVPVIAAVLLSLGAAGCWFAMESGESDEDIVEKASPELGPLLDEHKDWAQRTFAAALAAAVLATASIALFRFPKSARLIAVTAAVAAFASAYAVYQTGHHGGALVYGERSGAAAAGNPGAIQPRAAHEDED